MLRWLPLLVAVACKPPVPIFNYHSVGVRDDDFAIPEQQLAAELDLLQTRGLRTISLHDLAERRFSPGDVVLTFDDGYADALTVILPQLRARGMRATFFVVTAFLGRPGYLDWEGVRALQAAGMEIGSHTVDHQRLPELSAGRVRWELAESKRLLDARLPRQVEAVAYPFNAVRGWMLETAAEAGYRVGVAGVVNGGGDPLDLARVTIRPDTTLEQFEKALPEKRSR